MNWTATLRLLTYALGLAAGGAATWAAWQGWGTYDPATDTFDLAPFRVGEVVGMLLATVGNALAALALWRGWGRK
jgi:hypothetical protein